MLKIIFEKKKRLCFLSSYIVFIISLIFSKTDYIAVHFRLKKKMKKVIITWINRSFVPFAFTDKMSNGKQSIIFLVAVRFLPINQH